MKQNNIEQNLRTTLGKELSNSSIIDEKLQETYATIRGQHKTTKTNETKGRKTRRIAAACAALLLVIAAGNTTTAKSLFSKAFDSLLNSTKGSKYEAEDATLYNQVAANATSLDTIAAKEEFITTVTDNGTSLSVSDVYCDGYLLYYTLNLETDFPGIEQVDYFNPAISGAGTDSLFINDTDFAGVGNLLFYPGEGGGFTAMGTIDLLYAKLYQDFELPKDGILKINLSLDNLTAIDEQGEWIEEDDGAFSPAVLKEITGDFRLSFPVEIDTSSNITVKCDQEDNGIKISNIIKTPSHLIVEMELPDMTKAPYNDPFNDPAIVITDETGELLPPSHGIVLPSENDGSKMYQICMYSESKLLNIQVINKNVDNDLLAEFSVEMP